MHRSYRHAPKVLGVVTVLSAAALAAAAGAAAAAAPRAASHGPKAHYVVRTILSGASLSHKFRPAGSATLKSEPLSGPDDITAMGGHLFAGFQNGVGSTGGASTSGNLDSTVVEFTGSGHVLRQWDIRGKCDGLTADPAAGVVIATVNEDGNSSIYTIRPGGPAALAVRHYRYDRPLPSKGGTDAITVYRRMVLISASAPGTNGAAAPQPTYPAVYRVTFNRFTRVATIHALFFDEAGARIANLEHYGKPVKLALTDPDSNAAVPAVARRFGGTFELTSQGDKQQIYVVSAGTRQQRLWVLNLSQSVDDTAWVTRSFGRLYASDGTNNAVDVITGRFPVGMAFEAVTPCDAGNAPATCPAPGFPPNYLGALNPFSGVVSPAPVSGVNLQPKGMLFVAR